MGSRQLRDKVQTGSGTIYHRLNIRTPEKEGANKFEFTNTYKPQGGIHQTSCAFENLKLLCFPTAMELLSIYAQGVSLRVVIWPMEMQGFLKNTVLIVAGTAQGSALMVGDVPEIYRHEA